MRNQLTERAECRIIGLTKSMSSAAKILSQKNSPVASASRVWLTIFPYGLAFVTIAAALMIGSYVWQLGIRHVQDSMLVLAIALTAWCAGMGPPLVATLFSAPVHNRATFILLCR